MPKKAPDKTTPTLKARQKITKSQKGVEPKKKVLKLKKKKVLTNQKQKVAAILRMKKKLLTPE